MIAKTTPSPRPPPPGGLLFQIPHLFRASRPPLPPSDGCFEERGEKPCPALNLMCPSPSQIMARYHNARFPTYNNERS